MGDRPHEAYHPHMTEPSRLPLLTPAEAQVYMEGYAVAQLGASPEECEYDRASDEYVLWLRGYVEGLHDMPPGPLGETGRAD